MPNSSPAKTLENIGSDWISGFVTKLDFNL
jgi:hypothetical protein